MTAKIVFNEYGNPNIPDKIYNLQNRYWSEIEPYLDELSIVEVRALGFYVADMTVKMCEYILRRQMQMRKEERQKK